MDGIKLDLYIFLSIALFIMLIACFNYMNLATARSLNRAREVGLKKVIGASRTKLIEQFLSESLILSLISFSFAFILVILVLPWFSSFISRELDNYFFKKIFLFSIIGLTILIGFISGSYPALFLSSFQPVKILKGSPISNSRGLKGSSIFRNSLVITNLAMV